jgi:hypothetical protein
MTGNLVISEPSGVTAQLQITAAEGQNAMLYLLADQGDDHADYSRILQDGSGLAFQYYSSGFIEAMRIDSSGNVGIGESSPDNLLHITSAGSDTTLIKLENTNADSLSARMTFVRTSANPAVDDDIGKIDFYANDNAGNSDRYALMRAKIKDTTNGSEDAALIFSTVVAGSNVDSVKIEGGNTNITTGNLIIGTAGKGISFSSTNTPAQSTGSGTSNLLDDYEEGTFTATLTAQSAAPNTAVTETAYYTKIGRLVHVSVFFNNVNTTGASGDARVTGLPFTVGRQAFGSYVAYSAIDYTANSINTAIQFEINQTYIMFMDGIDNGAWENSHLTGGTGKYINLSGTYQV